MPELPEVHTTTTILNTLISGKKIVDVWSDYDSSYYVGKGNIKDISYFKKFKKKVSGKKIGRVYRRGKNILISLEGDMTILIHMKMTGHLLYGKYALQKTSVGDGVGDKKHKSDNQLWHATELGPLQDPFNQFIHFTISLSNKYVVAFSDMRKFATVKLLESDDILRDELSLLGPEPLENSFTWKIFKERLLRKPNQKIKTALMDQTIVVGIGNIYSDEMLWLSHIHPDRQVKEISDDEFKILLRNGKKVLKKGIDFGGDSMSDYRNPYGVAGDFQHQHCAYRRTGEDCTKKGCTGVIKRKVMGGRSAHFCAKHQK